MLGREGGIATSWQLQGPTALDDFRHAVMADPVLQARLSGITHPEAFGPAALAAAKALGIALDQAAIAAAGRPDPLALDRFGVQPPWARGWPGPGWRPVGVVATTGGAAVDWAHFGTLRPTEPFYSETADRARAMPFNRLIRLRTTLESLVSDAPATMRRPDGFVHHASRCGSTLIAQMLGSIAGATVLSEPSPLDDVVQIACTPSPPEDSPAAEANRIALLRAMVGALGQCGEGDAAGPYLIKLDCWHARALPLFRRAFPETPFVLAYRDPVEIMASHRRRRGMQMVPGLLPGAIFAIDGAAAMPLDDFGGLILDRIMQAMLNDGEGGALVDYAELPNAVSAVILPHFGINATAADRVAMARTAERSAKEPEKRFMPDSAAKQASADEALYRATAAASVTYRLLEQRRLAQRSAIATLAGVR